MTLNGILAGLVGITAGADLMSPLSSIIIGLIACVIVVFAVIIFDRIKIDDPVGAISVHLICGIFGTLAVGIFGEKAGLEQLFHQAVGILTIGAFVVSSTSVMWFVIKKTVGIRVSQEEEYIGLDIGEHAMEAYPYFEKVS